MQKGSETTGIHLEARQAAYLRAFASVALELRFVREHINDEAQEVIGAALTEIGRQLARLQYPEGLLWEDMFGLLFLPSAFNLLDQEEHLRSIFTTLH
jgi:hypothetical protein